MEKFVFWSLHISNSLGSANNLSFYVSAAPDLSFSSDLDDTYNGHNADIPIYPVKKYHSKYSDPTLGKKYKPKNKVEEVTEKVLKLVEENYEISIKGISGTTPVDGMMMIVNKTEDVLADEGTANATEEIHSTDDNGDHSPLDLTTTPSSLLDEDIIGVAAATSLDREVVASGAGLGVGSITGIALSILVLTGLIGKSSKCCFGNEFVPFLLHGTISLRSNFQKSFDW